MAATYTPPAVGGSVEGEADTRAAADEALQDAIDALEAAGASDAELAAAVTTLTTAVAAKQDASTAATDAEVTSAVGALSALVATDVELAAALATINTALGLKQDASTAATDVELAAHIADTTAVHGIADTASLVLTDDARLSDQRTPSDGSVTPTKLSFDPATQVELDAEATARSGADTTHAALTTGAHNLAALLTDAKARANHTGSQASGTISDFTEAVQDAVAALLGAGSNITLNYDDVGDTLEIVAAADGSGLDAEAVRDAIGVALVGAGLVGVAVNDGADTITISTTATANDTNANLRDRATHTGAQAIATVTGLQAALDLLAPLASPALTGNPTAPTQAQGNSTTRLATTAYVQTEAGLLVPKSAVDAKGDLLVASANDTVGRLAVGTNGQVLTADSGEAVGVKWATPASTSVVVLGADRTNADASANTIADVTGLAFAMLAATRYWFRFVIEFTTPIGTTGSRWALNGPAAPTRLTYIARWTTLSSSERFALETGYDATGLATSSNAGANWCVMEGIINNGANAGNLIARFSSEVSASAVVAKAGSFVEYMVLA